MRLSVINVPHLKGKVNTKELELVQALHMPADKLRWAAEPEIIRVAQEVATEYPELADEADHVAKQELHRRAVKMALTA
ncbi:hypothetical protein LJ737_19725 [Hymenobacter sp. 15J16-1T3B]|uniref:hypothetical protein n=1 Tax=Hymenobacter sp. 15J16-1T3B TaxID=2886941 RepID=UPI001D0F7CA6|nr:hypothetical protein [Hymenobacter sp. 15J16-1T3B]MCC3159481.1 hypothetical protein [Hymenobacter sp. 15J16-1T3B]